MTKELEEAMLKSTPLAEKCGVSKKELNEVFKQIASYQIPHSDEPDEDDYCPECGECWYWCTCEDIEDF